MDDCSCCSHAYAYWDGSQWLFGSTQPIPGPFFDELAGLPSIAWDCCGTHGGVDVGHEEPDQHQRDQREDRDREGNAERRMPHRAGDQRQHERREGEHIEEGSPVPHGDRRLRRLTSLAPAHEKQDRRRQDEEGDVARDEFEIMAGYRAIREVDAVRQIDQRLKPVAKQPEKMWQEYPSTPNEAFQVSTEGVYYAKQLQKARTEGRIGRIPHREGTPVNTFWDIGKSDNTSIWFHQAFQFQNCFIRSYQNTGEYPALAQITTVAALRVQNN
jgi:hypothetical protein